MADDKRPLPSEIPLDDFSKSLTGQGTFRDTGRQSTGLGEAVDSVTGVPVRTLFNELAKHGEVINALQAAAQSIGTDPQQAPTGYDVGQNMGIENPYLGAAVATGVDLAQLPVGAEAAGVSGSVKQIIPKMTAGAEAKALESGLMKLNKAAQAGEKVGFQTGVDINSAKALKGKLGFAEGGEVPFDPDAFLASASPQQMQAPESTGDSSGFDPNDFLKSVNEEVYGGAGQMAKTALEGAAQGVLGPIAPAIEKHVLGVNEEDIRNRAETNPVTHGVGEAVGLGGSMLAGTGLGSAMTHAGQLIEGVTTAGKAVNAAREGALALGLGETAAKAAGKEALAATSYGARVGSEAAKQAAEMAVLQGSDEISKMILNDPETSAENAIANIGMAAALGSGTGAFVAGAVSPLWKATVGNRLDSFLSGVTSHLNGEAKVVMPENVAKSFETLGFQPEPVMRAALSGDEKALGMAQDLYRAQHPEFLKHLNSLPAQVRESVTQSLGVSLDDAAVFSAKETGDSVRDKAISRIQEQYGPIAAKLDKRDAEAAVIGVADEARRDFAGQVMEKAINTVGTDSPYYKDYENYAQRIMAKNTIGGLDQLSTELYKKAKLNQDLNQKDALDNIRGMIGNFKEKMINSQAKALGKEGSELGAEMLAERAATNRDYAIYAKQMQELTDHLGIGNFKGTGTLKDKLEDLSAEQLIKKFSTKGDAGSAEVLRKLLPDVAEEVRQYEAKKFLSSSITEKLGEYQLDTKKLAKQLESLQKGSPEFASYVLNPTAVERIKAAKVVSDAASMVTGIKDSGTPGGLGKVFKHLGASTIGAMGFLLGHNPIGAAIVGEIAHRLGKDVPEAAKLAMLKFLASDQPIKAEGFKAMVDFIHHTAQGESALSKATKNLFRAGVPVLASHLMPKDTDRNKLDNIVQKTMDNPESMMKLTQGDTGHYMPSHQASLTQTATTQLQYLQALKPKPFKPSPLDREIPPTPAQDARYHRALDIANSPNVVLDHMKKGTLQISDVQDLKAMYPAYYAQMANKITQEMTSTHEDNHIPYKQRVSMSIFLGQPLDSTMTPTAIQTAQLANTVSPKQGSNQQPMKGKKGTSSLGKTTKSYMTPGQAAEADRGDRD